MAAPHPSTDCWQYAGAFHVFEELTSDIKVAMIFRIHYQLSNNSGPAVLYHWPGNGNNRAVVNLP